MLKRVESNALISIFPAEQVEQSGQHWREMTAEQPTGQSAADSTDYHTGYEYRYP